MAAMTIKVYEVDRYGKARILRPKTEVTPAKTVDQTAAYPACQCDQCTRSQQR